MQDEDFMRMAIEKAGEGIAKGQTPFGACIVKDGRVIAVEHNAVWASTDITAHAEITAIREACRDLVTVDLSGCTIYSTTEPCPMCFSACHWARISRIVYGTEIADVKALGFHELTISNHEMKRLGDSPIKIEGGLLREENLALLSEWAEKGASPTY